jgi:hypothetical protein
MTTIHCRKGGQTLHGRWVWMTTLHTYQVHGASPPLLACGDEPQFKR